MDTTTKSYREIIRFINAATAWQQQSPKKDSPMTGFKYAISRVLKSTGKAFEDYNDKLTDINIDAASTDEKGNILSDARGTTIFKKEESKTRNAAARVLSDTEVEVGVYFAKKWPSDLTPFQLSAFEGFVIPEIQEPTEE